MNTGKEFDFFRDPEMLVSIQTRMIGTTKERKEMVSVVGFCRFFASQSEGGAKSQVLNMYTYIWWPSLVSLNDYEEEYAMIDEKALEKLPHFYRIHMFFSTHIRDP